MSWRTLDKLELYGRAAIYRQASHCACADLVRGHGRVIRTRQILRATTMRPSLRTSAVRRIDPTRFHGSAVGHAGIRWELGARHIGRQCVPGNDVYPSSSPSNDCREPTAAADLVRLNSDESGLNAWEFDRNSVRLRAQTGVKHSSLLHAF